DLELGFLCPVVVVPGLRRSHPARGTHAPPRGHPHTALPPGPTRAAAVFRARPHRHRALRRPRATSHPTGGHPQPAHPTTGPRLLGDQQVRGVRGVERPPAGPCLRGQFPSRFHLRLVQRTPGRQTVPLLRKQRHTHNTFPLGHTTPRTHAFGPPPLRPVAPPRPTRSPPDPVPGPRYTRFSPHPPGHLLRPATPHPAPTPPHPSPSAESPRPATPEPRPTGSRGPDTPSPHLTPRATSSAPPTSNGRPPPNINGRVLPTGNGAAPPPPATPTPGRPDRPTPNGARPFRKEPRPPRAAPVPQQHRGSGPTPITAP